MIYCSNLCTEIAQNMAPSESVSTEIRTHEGDTVVVKTIRPGDFVVCNLASLSLGHLPLDDSEALRQKVATVVRALDNVIDLNLYPVPYAQITNHRYRSIGLGVSGYHHALALRGIRWESEEHLQFVDQLFEQINFAAIEASNQLAREKGSYTHFEGSDWQTGTYFTKRGYRSARWQALAQQVATHGMRNAYLLAVAPTSGTSIIAGTTAGIDPVMKRFFLEEKKGAMLPRVAPALSPKTFWVYKAAHLLDQKWSVRAGPAFANATSTKPKPQPLHHQRIHHASSAQPLPPRLGMRRQDHLLRAQQVPRSRRMRKLRIVTNSPHTHDTISLHHIPSSCCTDALNNRQPTSPPCTTKRRVPHQ